MAVTERKQVLLVGDTVDENVSQVDEATVAIGGTMHGLAADLTFTGTGFMGVPTNEVVPTITGTAQVGETLTGIHGQWQDNNEPIDSYTYRWYADDVFITGATAATFEVTETEYGAVITFGEKAVNTKGTSAEAISAGTAAVVAADPTNSVAPAITGTAQVGETLTCSEGTWTDGGGTNTYAYQWKRGVTNVGTDQNTYVPVVGDIGATITCTVTATNDGGSLAVTSAATAAVIAA